MHDPDVILATADHPSLAHWFADFIVELRTEQRFFGPASRSNPKPFPSVIDGLERADGFRLAAVGCDRVVGGLRIDPAGHVLVAVTRWHRGRGIGTALLERALTEATTEHWPRLVIRTNHRSTAIARAAAHVGAVAVDVSRGRVDLILPVPADAAGSA